MKNWKLDPRILIRELKIQPEKSPTLQKTQLELNESKIQPKNSAER